MFIIFILRKYNDRYLYFINIVFILRAIDLKWVKLDIMNSIYLILKFSGIKS